MALLAPIPAAAAATGCDFAYDAGVRDTLVRPALATLATAQSLRSDFAAYYNLDKPSVRPTGRDDGTLILTFDSDHTDIDGPTLRVVLDPCARRVLDVDERQDNIAVAIGAQAFKTDDATVRKELVGSWIVPPDSWFVSPDKSYAQPDINLRIVQSFRADGSGVTQVYKDGACTVLDRSVDFAWSINNSMLTIRPAKSDPEAFLLDESSQSIGIALGRRPDRLANFAPDHKDYGLLNRAPKCGWPDNRQIENY